MGGELLCMYSIRIVEYAELLLHINLECDEV